MPSRICQAILRPLGRDGQDVCVRSARVFERCPAASSQLSNIYGKFAASFDSASLVPRPAGPRQLDHEARAGAKAEIQGDAAADGLDQTPTDRQSEPSSLAHVFGGHEWLEKTIAYRCGHAGSVVLDDQLHPVRTRLSRNANSTTSRQRVDRVEQQIEHELNQLLVAERDAG